MDGRRLLPVLGPRDEPGGEREPAEPTELIAKAAQCLKAAARHLDATVAARCTPASLAALRQLSATLHSVQPHFLP